MKAKDEWISEEDVNSIMDIVDCHKSGQVAISHYKDAVYISLRSHDG